MNRLLAATILFVIEILAAHPGAAAEVSFTLALKQLYTANETLLPQSPEDTDVVTE